MATTNILGNRAVYNRYYGDFRGVDFSSDHTQVSEQRFSYLANMYRDYNSGQGKAIETIPGFRRRMKVPTADNRIFAIHEFDYSSDEDTEPLTANATVEGKILKQFKFQIKSNFTSYSQFKVTGVRVMKIGSVANYTYNSDTNELEFWSSEASAADTCFIDIRYYDPDRKLIVNNSLGLPLPTPVLHEANISARDYISSIVKVTDANGAEVNDVKLDSKGENVIIRKESITSGDTFNITYISKKQIERKAVIVHAGNKLFRYNAYPDDADTEKSVDVTLKAPTVGDAGINVFTVDLPNASAAVERIRDVEGNLIYTFDQNVDDGTLSITSSVLQEGDTVYIYYIDAITTVNDSQIFEDMNGRESVSFSMNNRLYILDGKNYLVYNGQEVRTATENAYIPTTYINIVTDGLNADSGTEYEQRNLLSPYFKHTFVITQDGTNTFYMNEAELEAVTEVKVYGEVLAEDEYTVDLKTGKITTSSSYGPPEQAGFAEGYAGVEITAKKTLKKVQGVIDYVYSTEELITGCTLAAVFDGRVFFSGNRKCPNLIFYCERNATGRTDPTYFGILNYAQDGVSNSQITGIIAITDALMVLKSESTQDGAVFYHTPVESGNNIQPKIYPSSQGLAGVGCIGAHINFRDDPVFISKLGVEAIGQLSARYERGIEHRSSLIDANLVNLELANARLEEWNGYLVLLIEGKIFLADSRQTYTHETGVMQYEWYYLEDIGVYDGQYTEYHYDETMPEGIRGMTVKHCNRCGKSAKKCDCGASFQTLIDIPLEIPDQVYDAYLDETYNLCGTVVNPPDEEGRSNTEIFSEIINFSSGDYQYPLGIYYTVYPVRDKYTLEITGYKAYLCHTKGQQTGGKFRPATAIKTIDGNLFFGTENGELCSFNFDKRTESGEIPTEYYDFCGRTIRCGCATRMDNCGIPHLTKTMVKKSTVVKTKSFQNSAAKIKVRTNRKPYSQISRINSTLFSFDAMDFSDFSFTTMDQSLFSVKEKEKKWVEKQYYLYSDEFRKPFALYYISFRYMIAGRYKG
jgi:hypothetical protein